MPAIVYVWPNARFPRGAMNHPGHAALAVRTAADHQQITDYKAFLRSQNLDNTLDSKWQTNQFYISWWPKSSAWTAEERQEFPRTKIAQTRARPGNPNTAFQDRFDELGQTARLGLAGRDRNGLDLPQPFAARPGQTQKRDVTQPPGGQPLQWVQMPTYHEHLPLQGENPFRIGINETTMQEWWNAFCDEQRPRPAQVRGLAVHRRAYQFASKTNNCAGVVGLALEAGGSGWFIREEKKRRLYDWSHFVTLPMDVYRYTLLVQAGIRTLQETVAKWNIPLPYLKSIGASGLMAVDVWSQLSREGMGIFARRRAQVTRIDTLLQRYHGYGKGVNDYFVRMDCLYAMLWEAVEHMQTKSTSKRKDAMEVLAMQLVACIAKEQEATAP